MTLRFRRRGLRPLVLLCTAAALACGGDDEQPPENVPPEAAPPPAAEAPATNAAPAQSDAAAPAPTLSAAERAVYTGTYDLGVARVIIEEENERLMVQGTGPRVALVPRGEHSFTVASDSSVRLDFQVEDGRAVQLDIDQGGQRFSGRRIDE